ncbi:MAG: DMT family transporter [bacterium]|nr:DMT family transporter [bacterium]
MTSTPASSAPASSAPAATATAPALPTPRVPATVYLFLLAGVAATSLAAIFIRFAQGEGVPSLVIAAGRLTVSALILTPFVLRAHLPAFRALTLGDFGLAAVSGGVLALHFATWISSLEYTSVLISTVFVTTGPLWVALLEVVFLRARFRSLVWAGLGVALVGGLVIGAGDAVLGGAPLGSGSNPALGAALALTGAVAVAVYLVIGRKLRRKLDLLPYIWLVYSLTALFLVGFALLNDLSFTGYSAQSYLWIVLLALFPQLIGHTSFNYALKYVPATFVGIITQAEPISSAIAAIILFQEIPTGAQIVGSLGILAGVALASWGQAQKPAEKPESSPEGLS